MPMYRPAMTYRCKSCNWEKTVPKCSDVILINVNFFDVCPNCGENNIEAHRASLVKAYLIDMLYGIKRANS